MSTPITINISRNAQGPAAGTSPIPDQRLMGNVSGGTATPTALTSAQALTMLSPKVKSLADLETPSQTVPLAMNSSGAVVDGSEQFDSDVPIINMDDWGVHPGNSAATNQTAIANLIARIKNSSQINRFHLRLNRAGTFNIQRVTTGDYVTRRAAILLPSNCIFELSKDSVLRMPLEQLAWMVRNDDPINGNRNIEIIGGQWDGNAFDGVLEENAGPGVQGYYGDLMWFENITDFRVENVVVRNPNLWAIMGTKLKRAVFQSVYADNLHRDAIHLVGGCEDVAIYDFAGQAGDNALAIASAQNFAAGDGAYSFGYYLFANGTNVAGNMKNIRIERANFTNCNGPIAIFGRQADTLENIYISDITGTTSTVSAYAVAITQYQLDAAGTNPASINPIIRNVVIERVRVTTKPNEVAVFLSGNNTKDVVVRDVTANGAGVLAVGNSYDSLRLENINASGVEHAVQLGNDASGLAFYSKSVEISNLTYTPSGGSRSALNIETNATFHDLTVNNLNCVSSPSVTWQGVVAKGTTRKKITVKNSNFGPGGERCFSGPLDVNYDTIQYGHGTGMTWLAVDGARLTGDKLNYLGLGPSAVGFGSAVAMSKRVEEFVVNYTDFTTAGVIAAYAMPKLPRGAIITGAAIKANTQFSGGGVTEFLLRVRWYDAVAAAYVNIVADTNVGASVDTSRLSWQTASNLSHAMNAIVDWELLVQSSGANINACTQGQAVVFLEYFVACTSQQ
jgi:hypothetical protein